MQVISPLMPWRQDPLLVCVCWQISWLWPPDCFTSHVGEPVRVWNRLCSHWASCACAGNENKPPAESVTEGWCLAWAVWWPLTPQLNYSEVILFHFYLSSLLLVIPSFVSRKTLTHYVGRLRDSLSTNGASWVGALTVGSEWHVWCISQ